MAPPQPDQLDVLFALSLASFTAERDRLSKELAAAGDEDAARSVKAIRKPTLVAWTLNQLARSHPDRLHDLFATGELMARALDGGDAATAREAQGRRRTLLKEMGAAAAAILREGGHAAGSTHVDKVRSSLLQATTDAEAAAAIAAGRLEREPAGDVLPDAFAAPAAGVAEDDAEDAGERRRREQLATKVERLRAEAEAAAGEAARLARNAESARVAADAAEEVAETAQRAAERALRHLEEAEEELRRRS